MSGNGTQGDTPDPRAGATVFIGAAGGLALIIAFLALQTFFRQVERAEVEVKVVEQRPAELLELESRQLEQISGYRWIDPAKGTVGIPIERAMDIVASEWNARARK